MTTSVENQILDKKLENVLKNMKPITIEVENGEYHNDDFEIEIGDYLIRCSLSVDEVVKVTSATYLQPSERNVLDRGIYVNEIVLYDNGGDLIDLTENQARKISESVMKNIS